jgi:uncharacterized membrane protein YgcG
MIRRLLPLGRRWPAGPDEGFPFGVYRGTPHRLTSFGTSPQGEKGKKVTILRGLLACFALLAAFLSVPAFANEVITNFHSDITLNKDATMLVRENIDVIAEGDQIRRGIFRDFPLTFLDDQGREVSVEFDLISVTRDGHEEPYHTEKISGGIRIYAGDPNVFLDFGAHSYVFTYETSRQVRYFDDHDELYWNVTGNGWIFPIQRASATVTLPEGAKVEDTVAFTGAYGETGRDARASVSGNVVEFATTRPLGAEEGLTIGVKLPKGVVDAPSQEEQTWWFLKDNRNYIFAFGGLILVLGFYLKSWAKVGKDPERGVIVPRWDAPDGISPALVNYIDNKGFSGAGWQAFSAAAINLAVKGYVILDDLKSSIIIRRTAKPVDEVLPAGEKVLLMGLSREGQEFLINKANGPAVQSRGSSFRSAIEKEHRGRYYKFNTGYIAGGVILSILSIVILVVFGTFDSDTLGALFGIGIASTVLGVFATVIGRNLISARSLAQKVASVIALGFIGTFGLTMLTGILSTFSTSFAQMHELPVFFAVGGIVVANVVFFFLMGAPTPLGTKMMDGIDGLKMYLTLAEKDRLNMQGAPKMSPQHFEKLLPYAVALGVEKPWTRTFDAWLAAAVAAGTASAAYHPAWYSGGSFDGGRFGDSFSRFPSAMASTVASTIPAPKSSSSSSGFSSGGGFSGGGGGGGGGGGW